MAGRRPSLVLLHNYHLIINIFPFIPFLTSVRLWAVRGRRLLPFSRLTQLRAICYVRMERDKGRLRCERMFAIRRRFEGSQLQELAPPARTSHTQKDEVHTAAYLHTFACTHAYVHSLHTLRTPLAQLALLDRTDCAHYTRRLNMLPHNVCTHSRTTCIVHTHTTDAMPSHTVLQLSCLILFRFRAIPHSEKNQKDCKIGGRSACQRHAPT